MENQTTNEPLRDSPGQERVDIVITIQRTEDTRRESSPAGVSTQERNNNGLPNEGNFSAIPIDNLPTENATPRHSSVQFSTTFMNTTCETTHHHYVRDISGAIWSNQYAANVTPNFIPVLYPAATQTINIPNAQQNNGPNCHTWRDYYTPAVFNPSIPPPSLRPQMIMEHCSSPPDSNRRHIQQAQYHFMNNANDGHMYNQRDTRFRRDTFPYRQSLEEYYYHKTVYNREDTRLYVEQRAKNSRDDNPHRRNQRKRFHRHCDLNYVNPRSTYHRDDSEYFSPHNRNLSVEEQAYLDHRIRYDPIELHRIKHLLTQAASHPSASFAAELDTIPQEITRPPNYRYTPRRHTYETNSYGAKFNRNLLRLNNVSLDTATKAARDETSDSEGSYKSALNVTPVDHSTLNVYAIANCVYDQTTSDDDMSYHSTLDNTHDDDAGLHISSTAADNYSQTSSEDSFISMMDTTQEDIAELVMIPSVDEVLCQHSSDDDDSFRTTFNITPRDVDGLGNATALYHDSDEDEFETSASLSIEFPVPEDNSSSSTTSSLRLDSDSDFSDWSDASFTPFSDNLTDQPSIIAMQLSIVHAFFDRDRSLSSPSRAFIRSNRKPYHYTREELEQLGQMELGRVLSSSEKILAALEKIPPDLQKENWRNLKPEVNQSGVPLTALVHTQINTDGPALLSETDLINRGPNDYNRPSIDMRFDEKITRQVAEYFPTHHGSYIYNHGKVTDWRTSATVHSSHHPMENLNFERSRQDTTNDSQQRNGHDTSSGYRCEKSQWKAANILPDDKSSLDGAFHYTQHEDFIGNLNLTSPKQKRPDATSPCTGSSSSVTSKTKQSTTLNLNHASDHRSNDEYLNWRLDCSTPPINHPAALNVNVETNKPRDCEDYSLSYRGVPPKWRHESSTISVIQGARTEVTSQRTHHPSAEHARNCDIIQTNWRLDCATIPQSQQSGLSPATTYQEPKLVPTQAATSFTTAHDITGHHEPNASALMSDRGNKSEAFQTPHQQQEENAAIWQPPPQQSSLHGTSNWRPTDRHRSAYTHVYTPTSRPALELPPDEDVHNQGVQLSKGRQAWNLLEDGPCREASAPLSSDTISAERGVPKERVNRHAGDLPQVETEPKPNKQMCKRTLGRRVTFNMRCQEIEQQKTFTLPTRYPTGRNVIIRLGKSHGPLKGILKKPRPIGEVNIPHGESLMRFRPNRLRSDFPPIVYRASRPAGTYKAPKWCEYPPDPTHSGLPMAIVQGSYREMDVIFDPSHDDELLWCNKEYNPCYIHEFEANERKKPYPHNKQPVVQVEYKQAPTSTKIVATRMPIVVPIDEMRRIGAIEELTKREDIFPWEKAIPTDIQKHVVDVSFRGNVSSPLDQQLEDCAHGYIETADDPAPLKAVVTPYGVVSIFLRDRMRVDITTDFAIRIVNPAQNISLALCPHGSSVGLVHPKGRVWQYGTMLEMATNNTEGINHYAKSFREGISFMSDKSPIVYTLTDDGVDQGKDWFTDLGFDFIKYVFYHASRHGGSSIISGRATRMLKRSQYFKRHGEDHWLFHKLHIVQMADGNVSVYREQDSYRLVTSPRTGCASINTPTLKCTASLGTSQHLVALIADHKLFFDGQKTFTLSRGSRSVSYKPDAYFEFHNDPNQKRRRRQKKRNLPANPQ